MRCLTLAQCLQARGDQVLFICADQPGHLGELITQRGFVVKLLAAGHGVTQAGWADDAAQTQAALHDAAGRKADWLVVDHYQLDQQWQGALRASADRIMVIDDLANRPHDCDLLLDQNLVPGMQKRYAGKVPPACRQLLGPDYALLHPAYAELHQHTAPRRGAIRRILVFFGGADSANLTDRAIDAFVAVGRPDMHMDVVLGASSRHREAIGQKAKEHANISLHTSLPSLAKLMSQADLAMGAGGVTHWERLCLGLPCLVVTLSDNQLAASQELHRLGLVDLLGHHDAVDALAMTQALKARLDQGLPEEWSKRCMARVDGGGANRVRDALADTAVAIVAAAGSLHARPANLSDEALLLGWANDTVTRNNAFSSAPIAAANHAQWLRSKLGNPANARFYIVEKADGIAVGQVRFDLSTDGWEIDYAVSPECRGLGLGRQVLQVGLACLALAAPGATVLGQVKSNNLPSIKVFESLGFERVEARKMPPYVASYRLTI
jgi:UDP-2,4-diacetamido-2,4,6-trideoxy-beta-L-altropyranose hydrolase